MGRRLTSENAFTRLLTTEQGPLYWIASDRVIRYVNEPMADWLGVDRERLEGIRCEYRSTSGDPHFAHQLCPPPAAFQEDSTRFSLSIRREGGKPTVHPARALRLWGAEKADLGLLVLVDPNPAEAPSALTPNDLHLRIAQIRAEQVAQAGLDRFVGTSPASRRLREQIAAAAKSNACAIIIGPPGSGRETTARAIHAAGDASQRLLPIRCPNLSAELLRSMLDSTGDRQRGEKASILLLLEVDQLDGDSQEALGRTFRGPESPRILSTARTSLRTLAQQGKFDARLAEALSAIQIESPPLVERREDIPLLAQALLEQFNAGRETQFSGFSPEAIDLLTCYSWPGNIDQLAEVVRHAAEKAPQQIIAAADLPERILAARHAAEHPRESAPEPIDLDALLAQIEKELIVRALELAKGNKSKAASLLSLQRNRFLRKLEQFELVPRPDQVEAETPDFRPISEFPDLAAPLDAE